MEKRPEVSLSRSDVSYRHKEFQPYVRALGELALAWNDLQTALSFLFSTIVSGDAGNPTQHAIWHALKSDRSQRDILIAAAHNHNKINSKIDPKISEDIIWMCGKINVLEDIRNDALHSPLFAKRDDNGAIIVRPLTQFGHVRAQKLATKKILFEFEYCRDCAVLFTNFTDLLDLYISLDFLKPPARPVLPNRGDTNEKKQRPLKSPTK